MITGYDHVQVAIPRGSEDGARAFYAGLLGMAETPKPPSLALRGGCWFTAGEVPGVRRFHTHDPFGNRLEFQQT